MPSLLWPNALCVSPHAVAAISLLACEDVSVEKRLGRQAWHVFVDRLRHRAARRRCRHGANARAQHSPANSIKALQP